MTKFFYGSLILVLIGLIFVLGRFYYSGKTVDIANSSVIRFIGFEADAGDNEIAPPITNPVEISNWLSDIRKAKFVKNPDYHFSVILGYVEFVAEDNKTQLILSANIEQKLVVLDPSVGNSNMYTTTNPQLYEDIVDHIQKHNPAFYGKMQQMVEELAKAQKNAGSHD